MPKTIAISECCQQSAVIAEEGWLRNVKVIGVRSRNGRRYTDSALERAKGLYEGVKVNLDHPASAAQGRSVRERFGVLRNYRVKPGDGGYADLRYNPKLPLAEAVKWWAENEPGCLGLSHNAQGHGEQRDGVFVVEEISGVRSVDLVADPATTKGLFESHMDNEYSMGGDELDLSGGEGEGFEAKVGHLIVAILHDENLDMAAKRKKILHSLKLMDEPEAEPESEPEAEPEMDGEKKEAIRELRATAKQLSEELDRYKAREAVAARKAKAAELCKAARLPNEAVTSVFLSQLCERDEAGMKELIADRKILLGVKQPISAGKATGVTISDEAFLEQVLS